MDEPKIGLNTAYSVRTPDENRALYRAWAATYETDFAQTHGYIYHQGVAAAFAGRATGQKMDPAGAVLDVGCGTGIGGVALATYGFSTVDGIDISPEMLAVAAEKAIYRDLRIIDLTEPIPLDDACYLGVVSAGTFTHGHVGPEPLPELVRIGAAGAVFAIGINAEHFESAGFSAVFDQLQASGAITELSFSDIPMYDGADHEHANDLAKVALFTRKP